MFTASTGSLVVVEFARINRGVVYNYTAKYNATYLPRMNSSNFANLANLRNKNTFFLLLVIQMGKILQKFDFLQAKFYPSQKVENIREIWARSARNSKKIRARSARK